MSQSIKRVTGVLQKKLKGCAAEALAAFLKERKGAAPKKAKAPANLAGLVDHTLLKPEATPKQIEALCAEARKHRFASVCVNPGYVPMCAALLRGSSSMVCTVVGFPLGATSTRSKAAETILAVSEGAQEIDMVIPIGRLKGGDYGYVFEDIRAVVNAAAGRPVKVIIETSLLDEEQKIAACLLSAAAKAAFVKTSTGFAGGGATVEDVKLMREVVGSLLSVKASGGVRDAAAAKAMVAAGANRLGTSSGVAIVEGSAGKTGY